MTSDCVSVRLVCVFCHLPVVCPLFSVYYGSVWSEINKLID